MDLASIEDDLVSEIGISRLQARIFLFVTTHGKKTVREIAEIFEISDAAAAEAACSLQEAGSFIDLSETEFEAMHPRFTVVNMYRRSCKRRGMNFGPNKIVDMMGAILEDSYYSARTK